MLALVGVLAGLTVTAWALHRPDGADAEFEARSRYRILSELNDIELWRPENIIDGP
jgi:hypothetical protein